MTHPHPLQDQLHEALHRRASLISQKGSDCLRLFHGYNEGYPGVVIEKFGNVIVVDHKVELGDELTTIKDTLVAKLGSSLVIIAKGHQSLGTKLRKRFQVLHGQLEDANDACQEHGVRYQLQPQTPHNLGLYLDTRDARQWIRDHSEGRRILNLFAFTGSLGLSASIGRAKEVVHLDKSSGLLPRLKANYQLNQCPWDPRSFIAGDIYKHLPKAIRSGQRFGGIILDPPPKVYASRYAAQRPKGQDFAQLVSLGSQMLADDGWLLCFFHRFDKDWDQCEQEVLAASGRPLVLKDRLTSGLDFPEENPEKKLRVSAFSVAPMS